MGMLEEREWRCPTCIDLLFKPAVNTACGHIYCFWCLHKAMSPYTPSACPVCRTQYAHLPAICAKLHNFLSQQFREQYAARRRETEEEERELGAASPEPDPGACLLPTQRGSWRPEHFGCDRCGKLLCRPVVLICGHTVCGPTCLQPAASGGAEEYQCPACALVTRPPAAVCRQLADLLAELFPEAAREREAECRRDLEKQTAAQPSGSSVQVSCVIEPGLGQRQQQQQQQGAGGGTAGSGQNSESEQDPGTPRAATVGSAAGPTAGGGGSPERQAPSPQQQQQQQQALSPSLASALRRRQAEGGPSRQVAERLESSLRSLTGDSYVHHGVGCDGCGLYPIHGRRYKCAQCPDAIGFDLCGACMDRGVSGIVGRFNQRHSADHSMRIVRPRITAMHMLQAANPELPMEQLMWLLELTLGGGSEEDEAQPGQPQPHQPPGGGGGAGDEAHQGGAPGGGGEGGEGPSFPMLRRGPRPAHDPQAMEPSPGAFARGAVQQAAGGGGPASVAGAAAAGEEADQEEVHVALEALLPGGTG